jgi:hypothetical protein
MRFFEFKAPLKNNIENTEGDLEKLSDLADLDPSLEKKIADELKALISKINSDQGKNTEESLEEQIEDVRTLIDQLLDALESSEDPAHRMMAKQKIRALTQQSEKQAREQGFQVGVALSRDTRTGKLDKAKKLAAKVGKKDDWAIDLLNILERYENDDLINKFLDHCNNGTALSSPVVRDEPTYSVNLKSSINPEISEIFDNKEAFVKLVQMPFSEQKAGYGGGVGPGEALLAMIIPGAKRAPGSSDLEIDGQVWEVKGGGADKNFAWLDSAPGVSPAELKREFIDSITPTLGTKLRKKFTYSDGTSYSLSDIINLADFRDTKFKHLRTVFKLLDDSTKLKTLDAIYNKLFSSIKNSNPKIYKKSLNDSVAAIDTGNRKILADIQAKLGMIEYAVGSYKAENAFVYNYSTNELRATRGVDGIISSIDDPSSLLRTETITMGSSKKPSAGIVLASKAKRAGKAQYD